jgi:parallel beta-helix repeat protein
MLSKHRRPRPPRSTAVRIRSVLTGAVALCLLVPALAASASSSSGAAEDLSSTGGRTWYVATNGSGTAPGTKAQPLRMLAQAINRAAQGDTIVLRKGTYHERVVVTTPNLTITALPGEAVWMDGSSTVTGFRATGATWTRANWNYDFDHSPTFTRGAPDNTGAGWNYINPAYPMAAHPDQVWIAGKRLRQVKTPADVRAGTFAVDTAANKLVVGTNPLGKTVRASTLNKAISVRASGVHLSGFGVRRYAVSMPDHGAVTLEKPHTRMTRMKVVSNATSGLGVSADYIKLVNSTFSRNGLIGIHGASTYHLRMSGLTVKRNNLEHFNKLPMAGGIKIGRARDVSIRDSVVTQNIGNGVWFDESVYDSRIVNNRVNGNTGHGVEVELSERSVIANNMILGNHEHGILVLDTGAVRIYNNTLLRNYRPINIIQDKRTHENARSGHDRRRPFPDPTVPWRVQNVQIRNNVLAYARAGSACVLCVEDGSHQRSAAQMGIAPESNVYVRADNLPRWLIVWSSGVGNPDVFTTLGAFRTATGRERLGVHTTSPVVSAHGGASDQLLSWGEDRASAIPDDVADMIGVRTSLRRIGVIPWQLNW